MTVYAAHPWKDNAHMVAFGLRPLGYVREDWPTLDVTYGLKGVWWKLWRPDILEAHDVRTTGLDFRYLPEDWTNLWKVIAYDPPYKLNGRSTPVVDDRYGVTEYMTVADRKTMMMEGMVSVAGAVAPGGFALAKCQDQVCGGKVHWQTDWLTRAAEGAGLIKVDRLDLLRARPQPKRTRQDGQPSVQQHARRNGSTLLVFEKPGPKRRRKVAA